MLFAQVREDPAIELYVATTLLGTGSGPRVLCIASGGCTALTLSAAAAAVTAIDMSLDQIYLCELKRALCIHYDIPHILRMYQTQGDLALKQDIVHDLYDNHKAISSDCYIYWMDNPMLLYDGINQCGVFEHLFEEVARTGDFDRVFSRKALTTAFGETAVNQSTEREFSDHFREVVAKYRAIYGDTEEDARKNYFYYQIAYNRYHPLSLPAYLQTATKEAIKGADIRLIVGSFMEHLQAAPTGSYDMIQTSNITDWMTVDEISALLRELERVCAAGGYVVMRRLNSDLALADAIAASGLASTFVAVPLPIEDTTFFYREVMCLQRGNASKGI